MPELYMYSSLLCNGIYITTYLMTTIFIGLPNGACRDPMATMTHIDCDIMHTNCDIIHCVHECANTYHMGGLGNYSAWLLQNSSTAIMDLYMVTMNGWGIANYTLPDTSATWLAWLLVISIQRHLYLYTMHVLLNDIVHGCLMHRLNVAIQMSGAGSGNES